MRLILATFSITLAIFAAAAPHLAGQRSGCAIPIYNDESALLNADQSVNLHAVYSDISSLNAKFLRGFQNYKKSTGVKHPYAVERLEKRRNHIPLVTLDTLPYGRISVGTPPRVFTVVFDTGSAGFFLPGPTCVTCRGHSLWYPANSSTSLGPNRPFSFERGDEFYITGNVYFDTVSMSDFTVTDQGIGVATVYSSVFQYPEFRADGLMGLGFQTTSDYPIMRPIFETLVTQQVGFDPVFSFKLFPPQAELYIGGSNSWLYNGSFTYVPIITPDFWMVMIDNVLDVTFLKNVPAIIDTGASYILGIPSQVIALHTLLGGTAVEGDEQIKHFTFPCHSFPTIDLTFGGTSFSITPSALNMGEDSADSPMCISGIIPHFNDETYWVIGKPFLQTVYTRFDYGNRQVGFAQLARYGGV